MNLTTEQMEQSVSAVERLENMIADVIFNARLGSESRLDFLTRTFRSDLHRYALACREQVTIPELAYVLGVREEAFASKGWGC